jgi:putative ABC transport system permease protein
MFKNYLKTAIRQLTRNRLFSSLNIIGLAIGLCGSIFIFLWLQDELSFDRDNPQSEDIYRLVVTLGGIHAATTPIDMGPYLQRNLPQVKQSVRFLVSDPVMLSYGEKRFVEKKIWYADSNFQQLFNLPLVKGDPAHIFQSWNEVLLTESTAKRYFGDKDPMGQRLKLQARQDLLVTGVLKDLPENSHMQFDMLLPMLNIGGSPNWDNFSIYTYLRLDHAATSSPGALAKLDQTLDAIYKKNGSPMLSPALTLQHITDIHLGEHYLLDVAGQGSLQYVRIFSLVAIFILVIACINFMNLSTALSSRRAKEVGLRKTVGASRMQLIGQFLGEAVFLALIALGLGVILVWLLLPLFDQLTGKSFTIEVLGGSRIVVLLGIAIFAGLLSGSYPALALSAFRPAKVLKGNRGNRRLRSSQLFQHGRAYFRNGLVVLQFTIAIALMVGTLVVYRQLQFIRDRDMGFDKSNLLYADVPQPDDNNGMRKGARQMEVSMASAPGVVAHSIVGDLPTYLTTGDGGVDWPGKDPKNQTIFSLIGADENTLNVFGMHLLTGRNFSKAYGSDDSAILMNEAAIRAMHMDLATAVGKTIRFNNRKTTIIGVVKDFSFKPIQFTVEPLLMPYNFTRGYMYVVIKTAPGNADKTIAALKKAFEATYPQYPFNYGFVDKDLDALYSSEQRMGKLFNAFSVMAIFISCLGLFGLSAYTTQRRIKEIGGCGRSWGQVCRVS